MARSHLALEAVVRHEGRTICRCLLRRGRYVIGQQKKSEIWVDVPSVSATHARLTVVSEEQFFLEDLNSANGTEVDGHRIVGTVPITLESEILLGGEAMLCFQRGGLPAAIFQHLPPTFLRSSRYGVGKAIVEGRTSTIYETDDRVLQRTVALRVLHPDDQARPTHVLGFIREIQIAAQISHSGILPVYDFGLDREIGLYCTTRFLEGESLANLLDGMAGGAPDAPHASLYALLLIFVKACDAVSAAHLRGVVHSTLRPESVIFGRFGEVFVDHWGSARIFTPPGAEGPLVHAPPLFAAPPLTRYSSPEQAAETEALDPRTDVYALGAILFRILTLHHFCEGESGDILLQHVLSPLRSPAEALAAASPPAHIPGGQYPERLAHACIAALSFGAEERYADAHELKKEIAAWLEGAVAGGEQGKKWKGLGGFFTRH